MKRCICARIRVYTHAHTRAKYLFSHTVISKNSCLTNVSSFQQLSILLSLAVFHLPSLYLAVLNFFACSRLKASSSRHFVILPLSLSTTINAALSVHLYIVETTFLSRLATSRFILLHDYSELCTSLLLHYFLFFSLLFHRVMLPLHIFLSPSSSGTFYAWPSNQRSCSN